MTSEEILELLDLRPLPQEGGFFRETYRSPVALPASALSGVYSGPRRLGTAIYYLLTSDSFSAMHRVPGDEVFHFYFGDAVEMLLLRHGRPAERVVLGQDLRRGQRPQFVVPGGVWQGARVIEGGRFALLGTTMSPGFAPEDFELGDRANLLREFPQSQDLVRSLTRA